MCTRIYVMHLHVYESVHVIITCVRKCIHVYTCNVCVHIYPVHVRILCAGVITSMCVSTHVFACVYQRMHMHVFINARICMCLSTDVYVCVYQRMYVHVFINARICMCLSTDVYVRVYQRMYVHVCINCMSTGMSTACDST